MGNTVDFFVGIIESELNWKKEVPSYFLSRHPPEKNNPKSKTTFEITLELFEYCGPRSCDSKLNRKILF